MKPDPVPQDSNLLSRFLSGHKEAFDQMVLEYADSVRGVLFRIMQNKNDAEDAAQETFFRVYKNAAGFKGESSLKTWILRIAINVAMDFGRRRQRKIAALPLEKAALKLPANTQAPHEGMVLREKQEALARALKELPFKQRAAITLKILEGQTNQEIAHTLGVSKDAVKANLHHARKRLLKVMNR